MQIRSVMTSYCLQLKSGKYWMNDISGNIEALSLKLGTTNVHQKRNKMTPLVLLSWQQFCRWCCFNENRNSRFCLKTKTMSVRSRTLWLTLEIANGDIYFFDRKRHFSLNFSKFCNKNNWTQCLVVFSIVILRFSAIRNLSSDSVSLFEFPLIRVKATYSILKWSRSKRKKKDI